MLGTLFSTRRAEPDHLLPAAGGTVVLALLLPVVALVGWSIAGWGLAALLWLGLHGLDLLVVRARSKPGGGVASSGIQAFTLFFKLIALLVVLFAALAADRNLALTTALTYGLAYTFELGLSLATYFGTPSL
jgi:hypothetical protein